MAGRVRESERPGGGASGTTSAAPRARNGLGIPGLPSAINYHIRCGAVSFFSRRGRAPARSRWRRGLSVAFLSASEETADCYARIWSALRQAGRPIPINDVWIAAQAMETGSVLVAFDAHFAQVPGLRIWEQ
ncbi:MAG: PIN domain-containing protein [Candidatus Aminicenantes bacterium]|nr:PIN domain-containing protein [Candidatus Aminicenantes bacterium]